MQENSKENFKITGKAVILGYFAQLFNYGVAIFVLPFILKYLTINDLAIWYIFVSISSIVSLLDFGFSITISRQVSYIYAGAQSLCKDGCSNIINSEINFGLLKSVLETSKKIYRRISICIFVLLLSAGTIYLSYVSNIDSRIMLIWFLYVIGITINFYYYYINAFILGRGAVSINNMIILCSKLTFLIVLSIGIYFNWGLLSLVLAQFANILVTRILGIKCYIPKMVKKQIELITNYDNCLSVIGPNAGKQGIVSIGSILLSQAGTLISGLFLSLEQIAQLGLTLQIFGILSVLCRVCLQTHIPLYSALWVNNNIKEIRQTFLKDQIIAYLILFIGSLIIIFKGNCILKFIGSNVMLPPANILILYFIFYLMEMTHGNCVSLISTENKVPYYIAGIMAGITSVLVTLILLASNWGLVALPLGLISGNLPYNSWKWPLVVYKKITK